MSINFLTEAQKKKKLAFRLKHCVLLVCSDTTDGVFRRTTIIYWSRRIQVVSKICGEISRVILYDRIPAQNNRTV